MTEISEELLFDVRLAERNNRRGAISREQYETYREKAEDMAEHAEYLDVEVLANDGVMPVEG